MMIDIDSIIAQVPQMNGQQHYKLLAAIQNQAMKNDNCSSKDVVRDMTPIDVPIAHIKHVETGVLTIQYMLQMASGRVILRETEITLAAQLVLSKLFEEFLAEYKQTGNSLPTSIVLQ